MPPKGLWRLFLIIIGAIIMVSAIIAQATSYFTPYIITLPSVLYLFTRGGEFIFFTAMLLFLGLAFYTRRSAPIFMLLLCGAGIIIIRTTLIGKAFQFGFSGLTIGGGLVILGSVKSLLTSKNP